jgi:hypothetical protein
MMADKPDECEACSYPTHRLKEYTETGLHRSGLARQGTKWLCSICDMTPAGYIELKAYDPNVISTAKSIAQAANVVLDAVEETNDRIKVIDRKCDAIAIIVGARRRAWPDKNDD